MLASDCAKLTLTTKWASQLDFMLPSARWRIPKPLALVEKKVLENVCKDILEKESERKVESNDESNDIR